ncbi:hypothetical protein [Marinicellulosiphila megalodicopiae]|uniref:hypothetical protein n=1 Tax=Marinicellulosiphila megalodicopiae TaxID=2724896 RepID=UPI003BB15355
MANSDLLYDIAEEVSVKLDAENLLVNYDFTVYENKVVQEFVVKKGAFQKVESYLIMEYSKINPETKLDITIIENDNEDVVNWIHDSD